MFKSNIFFITGCARSGTTSLCKILDMATNATCLLEPVPNLNRECRDMIEGRLKDPRKTLEQIRPRIEEVLKKRFIYGEKNVTLVPFIPVLYKMFDCKFVYIKRDGREVVRSLLDWHNQMFGTIYRECKERGELSGRAIKSVSSLPIELDTSDYSRPRPLLGDPFYQGWMELSRLEMCAWYWFFINNLALDNLNRLPEDTWISIDYTSPTIKNIMNVISFLELEGIDEKKVEEILKMQINSLKERTGENKKFPCWQEWSQEQKDKFDKIAESTMIRLGYYPEKNYKPMPKPLNFGKWWKTNDRDLKWYTWM